MGLWLGGCATSPQLSPDNESSTNTENLTIGGSSTTHSRQPHSNLSAPLSGTTPSPTVPSSTDRLNSDAQDSVDLPLSKPTADQLQPLNIERKRKTGSLKHAELSEISGLSASTRYPGLLYAINDSGNAPILYAIDETGQLRHQWNINARNRDWEDMARVQLAGTSYLVIGDTGDNLRIHKQSTLHLLTEPTIPATVDTLVPAHTLTFRFEDGPRNVEAFAAYGSSFYLLSKEPVSAQGRAPNGIYQLDVPDDLSSLSNTVLTARRVGTMPLRPAGLEAKLAAAVAGVDLSHPTAMAFDTAGNTAYILTYREVLSVTKSRDQSWAEAFSLPATQVTRHALAQAEALTVSAGRAIWFTSENVGAPLWAIPLDPPL